MTTFLVIFLASAQAQGFDRPDPCSSELIFAFNGPPVSEVGVGDGVSLFDGIVVNTGDCAVEVESVPFSAITTGAVFGEFHAPRLVNSESGEVIATPGPLGPFVFDYFSFVLEPGEELPFSVLIDSCAYAYEGGSGSIMLTLDMGGIRALDENSWFIDRIIPGADIVGNEVMINCSGE